MGEIRIADGNLLIGETGGESRGQSLEGLFVGGVFDYEVGLNRGLLPVGVVGDIVAFICIICNGDPPISLPLGTLEWQTFPEALALAIEGHLAARTSSHVIDIDRDIKGSGVFLAIHFKIENQFLRLPAGGKHPDGKVISFAAIESQDA